MSVSSSTPYDRVLQALVARGAPLAYSPGANDESVAALRWLCPVHGGSDALSIRRTDDGRALIKCFGCAATYAELLEALGVEDAPTGCTVASLAEYLGLPEEWLDDEGWEDDRYRTRRVTIPYGDDPETGETRIRYRAAHDGSQKFKWSRGVRVKGGGLLYAEGDLAAASCSGVFLVEGESDTITIKRAGGYYAVGLPGAGMWEETTHAPKFADVAAIYVVVEPDQGGETLLASLARSAVRGKVQVVTLPGAKDARAFCLLDPPSFRARLDTALANAETLDQREDRVNALEAQLALSDAGDLPTTPNLTDVFLTDLREEGLVGEEAAVIATALALISPLQHESQRPASAAIKGVSGGGKSETSGRVMKYFPGDYFISMTAASEKALIYSDEDYRHRTLVIGEASALESRHGDDTFLAKIVRGLLSEGRIVYPTVLTQQGELPRTVVIEKEGPTGLIVTTTAVRIHPENETRILSVPIDDSSAQTRRIMDSVGAKYAGNIAHADRSQWHAYFKWLRLTYRGSRVVVPYAPDLVALIPPVATRMRRDVSTLLSFVCAHALLHGGTRERDAEGRIVATLYDYAVVLHYLGHAFSENVRATVPDDVRETVTAVTAVIDEKRSGPINVPATANYKEIGERLGIDREAATRRVAVAVEDGWLVNTETRDRQPAKIDVGAPLPDVEQQLLPSVEALQERITNAHS